MRRQDYDYEAGSGATYVDPEYGEYVDQENGDDDAYDDGGYVDGSGDGGFDYTDAGVGVVDNSDEVFVRITLTVGERWNQAYLDPSSLAYKQMARRLKSALSGFYSNVNGVQSVNVVKFQ